MPETSHTRKNPTETSFSWAESLETGADVPLSLHGVEAELHRNHGMLPTSDTVDHYPQTDLAVEALRKKDDVFDYEQPENYGKKAEQEANAKIARYLELHAKRTEVSLTDEESDEYTDLDTVIVKGEYSLESTAALVAQYRELMQFVRTQEYYDGDNFAVLGVLKIPTHKLRELYMSRPSGDKSTDNPLQGFMDDEQLQTPLARKLMMTLCDKIFGPEDLVRLSGTDSRLRHVLEAYDSPVDAMLDVFPVREIYTTNAAEHRRSTRTRTYEILRTLGLPGRMRQEYTIAAMIRNSDEDGKLLAGQMKRDLKSITHKVDQIGIEKVTQLYHATGMENIWMYSDDEIDTMVRLVEKDPETIEYLKAGDVTIVLADIRGDDNGAFARSTDKKFSDDAGRTLRFEITSAESIYRHFIFLNRLGIRPSTVVFGGHGMPGATGIGMGLNRTYFTVDDRKYESTSKRRRLLPTININATQIARLARDYMQPSRGVDSHHTQIGRKTVVLSTCSGDKVVAGMGGAMPSSVAESVARTINDPETSIIAGEGVLFSRLNRDGSVTFVDHDEYKHTKKEISTTRELVVGRKSLWRNNPLIYRSELEEFHTRKSNTNEGKTA